MAARTPASSRSSWASSARRRSCDRRRCRSPGSPRPPRPASACPRCSTSGCRTTGSRCRPATSTARAATCGCARTRPPPCRSPPCRAGRGRRSTSTPRTASRSPHVRAGSRGAWSTRWPIVGCPCRPRTSSSSPSAGIGEDGGFEPAHEGPGYSDIALVANHAFALDLIATMQAQGLQSAAVPSRVRGRPVRDVDRAPRAGRGRRRGHDRAPDRARRRRTARVERVLRAARRGRHRQRHAPAPQPVGTGPPPDVGRRRSGRHAGARRGLRGRHPARAAEARRRRRADLRELPPPAAGALGGRDAVLGHGEPRGVPAVRRRRDAADRRRRERGGEAGRRHGEPLPGRRRDAGGRAARPRHRRSPAAVDGGGSDAAARVRPRGARRPPAPGVALRGGRASSPRRRCSATRWGSSCSRRSSRPGAARPSSTPGSTTAS